MVIGDSQAQGLAAGLHRAARMAPDAHVLNDARPGTGLVAPETFDWAASIPALVAAAHPDVAVMMVGGNDRLPILAGGRTLAYGTDAWKAIYRTRVAALVQALRAAGVRVIWVGNPIAREAKYSRDMQANNAIFANVVTAQGGTFLDVWLIVSDGAGNYAGYGKTLAGTTARLRLDDGIHFTPAGYDILAARVMQGIGAMHLASSQH